MNVSFTNNTISITDPSVYDSWEKVLLGLVPVLVMSIAFLMYKRIKRLPNGENDSVASRLALFYKLTAGIIWGQFFFHSFINATTYGIFGYRVRSLFFLLGYSVMYAYDLFNRISHSNPNFVGRSGTSKGTEFTLRKHKQQDADYTMLSGNGDASILWDITEENLDLKKRRFIAHIYYVMITFNCMVDGLFLVYNGRVSLHIVDIILFSVIKVMESISLFTVLIHSRMYTRKNFQKKWFYVLLFGWPFVVFSSIILVLCEVTSAQVQLWINHLALGIFYSISCGIMLWFSNYFQNIELEKPTRAQIRLSFLFFISTALVYWVTELFI